MSRRLFEVQVQGKFKRAPAGEVFVGAEASQKLELGILTRSISRLVLQFISTMVGDLHYSFGDNQNNPAFELPHVVSPIFPTFDKILITPPGETPPPLGIPFQEDPEYRKKRLKCRLIKDAQVDLDTIYSFSVNTSNLDLINWTVVGIPMVRPMDLRTYSGSGSVNLIGYEIPYSVLTNHPHAHPHKMLNYVFCMKLSPVSEEELAAAELPLISSDNDLEEEGVDDGDAVINEEHEAFDDSSNRSTDDEDEEDEEEAVVETDEDEEDEEGDEDEEESEVRKPRRFSLLRGRREGKSGKRETDSLRGVGDWFRRRFTRKTVDGSSEAARQRTESSEAIDEDALAQGDSDLQKVYEQEAVGDLSFCPACVEVSEPRRRLYYLLPLPREVAALLREADTASFRLRSYSEISKKFPITTNIRKKGSWSATESRRRRVAATLQSLAVSHDSRLRPFLAPLSDADLRFLGGNSVVEEEEKLWRGRVAVALSRRHWTEQVMVLTPDRLVLCRRREIKRVSVSLPLTEVLGVRPLDQAHCPLTGPAFLEIETHARVFTLMIYSDLQLNGWMQAFMTLGLLSGSNTLYRSTPSGILRTPSRGLNPREVHKEEVYIARPPCWKMDKKRVFNYRRILFKGQELPENTSPNELIECILQSTFTLYEKAGSGKAEEPDWQKFWNDVSLLQTISLVGLNVKQRLAFFLNLYHLLFLHGCLLFGPPPSWNLNAFFNNITYIVSFERISLADIELNVLRAGMARASLLSGVTAPFASFPGFGSIPKDFRLHYAINFGSISLLDAVPIYTPAQLDGQLDEVTRLTLDKVFEFDVSKKIIVMPKLPLQDYGVPDNGEIKQQSSVDSIDCLWVLAPYFKKQRRSLLLELLKTPQSLTIKSRYFTAKCRALKKWKDDATAEVESSNPKT
eukprot:scaffold11846_cov149-Ochromonas_danica.AAC.10